MQSLSARGVSFRIRRRIAALCLSFYTSHNIPFPTGRSTKNVQGRRRRNALSISHGRFLSLRRITEHYVAPTTTIPYLLSTSSDNIPSHSWRNSDFICAFAS